MTQHINKFRLVCLGTDASGQRIPERRGVAVGTAAYGWVNLYNDKREATVTRGLEKGRYRFNYGSTPPR